MNNVYIKNNLTLAQKADSYDVGIDLRAVFIDIVGKKYNNYYSSIDYIEYDTQIFLDSLQRNSEEQIYTLVYPRSSVSKTNLVLSNSVGVIDPNYRGSIKLRFKYFMQPEDLVVVGEKLFINVNSSKVYNVGDKIGQLVFAKTIPVSFNYVSELSHSDRSGGFGSTGK